MRRTKASVGRTTMAGALVVLSALGFVAGCGDGEDGREADGRRDASSTTTIAESAAAHLQGPRSPIVDGLVVPTGAKLAGAVFREIPYDLSDEEPGLTAPVSGAAEQDLPWEALLVIDGDPFAVYDDLAGQIRGDAVGLPMPGTADSCTWTVADPGPSDPDGSVAGKGEPVEVTPRPTSDGPADGFESDGQGEVEMAQLRAEIVAESPPPEGTTGVECFAQVVAGEQGGSRRMELDLRTDDHLPPTIRIRSGWNEGAPGPDEVGATAQVTGLLGQTTGSGVGPQPGPDRVPPGRANQLPVLAGQPVAAAGDAFGPYVNCFAEASSQQMRVPAGSVLVGTGWEAGEVSVLAVADADAATAALARQVEGPKRSPDSDISRDTYELADGTSITRYSHAVMAGGGGCSVLSSPDGRYLRVSAHSD